MAYEFTYAFNFVHRLIFPIWKILAGCLSNNITFLIFTQILQITWGSWQHSETNTFNGFVTVLIQL